jgi:dephospho-CoA kinase
MKICLTGGIACGKSLVSHYLNEFGFRTLDADDIVHGLISEEERKKLAAIVFKDPSKRKELESRIHPIVKSRINEALEKDPDTIAVIPLLFEVHWDGEFDIICSVVSSKDNQIQRMMSTRGYTYEEAFARLSSQMDVSQKALKSHYVIRNDGSSEELKKETEKFAEWLRSKK